MTENIFLKTINLIFPLSCSFCEKYDLLSSKISICKDCYKENANTKHNLPKNICKVCKSDLEGDICHFCSSRNIFFNELFYIKDRNSFESEVIRKIKFGINPYLSNYFRIGLHRILNNLKENKYISIVQIPSNSITLRKRPIPVSEFIINYLCKRLKIKVLNPIEKKSKELQSGKSFRERFIHAQNAFIIQKHFQNNLHGKYLLVDDVFTTGATVNEIAKLLLMNGAESVDILVLTKGKI